MDNQLTIPKDAQVHLIRKLTTLKNQMIHCLRDKKNKEQAELTRIDRELEHYQLQKLQDHRRGDIDYIIFRLEEAQNVHLREDEERWRLKSRMLWLAGGDKNTRFFHRIA